MVRLIKRRSVAMYASLVFLVVLAGAVALAGWLSSQSTSTAHLSGAASPTSETPSPSALQNPSGQGPASVQLGAQHLTPSSHLGVSAAGFLAKEQLALTVEDIQGHSYDLGALAAGADGRLRTTSVAPPTGLASGEYRLVVVGSTSHRRASAAFWMHDTPPTVALDTYSAAPGGQVGFAGGGFFPGEVVKAYLGSSKAPLASVTATGVGAVHGRMSVPSLSAGTYTLTLIGDQSQIPTSVGFSVQGFSPWVVLDRYALTPGETVGFMGHGFAPGEQVLVYLNSLQTEPVLRLKADTAGVVYAEDTWAPPSGAVGDNVLTFVGQSSKTTTTVKFTILLGVTPPAQPTPTPAP